MPRQAAAQGVQGATVAGDVAGIERRHRVPLAARAGRGRGGRRRRCCRRRPATIVDLSTNSPDVVRRLHERCASAGVAFVDAPVSGGRVKAISGELSVMVGGDEADVERVRPLLDCFAAQVFHVGPPGAGTVAKLVNNQLFLAAAVLVQEAYVLGAAAGLDPSTVHGIVRASSGGPYAALAPLLLGRRFDDVLFRLDIATKDLGLAVETAQAHGAEVPVSAAALATYQAALDAGLGPAGVPRHAAGDRAGRRHRTAAAAPPAMIDLSDDETFRGGFPHDHFRWLRDHDPVSWHEPTARTPDGEGFWVVSRHADVAAVLRDPVTFSSDRGGIREKGGTAIKDERTAGVMLNQTDDPQHQRLRALVNRGFTPRAVTALADELHRRGAALLDAAGDDDVRLRPRLRP